MTDDVIETEESTLEWVWGAIQDDFNENPTVGQIITNAAITAIPLVDQVADGRDLVANLKALIWDKRYNEMAVWLGLFFTLIGLIPSLGSLLKGVLKLVYRGAKLDEVFRVFNALAKGNAWEWLKKLRAGELRQHANEAAQLLKQTFDNIIDTLKEALSYVPSWAGDLYKNISDLIAEMKSIRNQIDEMFSKITDDLEAKLDDLLKQQADNSVEGSSRQTLMVKQEAEDVKQQVLSISAGRGSTTKIDGHKIYDSAFNPISSNPSATYRYSDPTFRSTGGDVYLAENIATSYFEVRKNIKGKSLYVGEVEIENILDLTDPHVLNEMGIDKTKLTARVDNPIQQQVYNYTNAVSNQAYRAGYSGILYESSRKTGDHNKALVLFEGRYDPDEITQIMNISL